MTALLDIAATWSAWDRPLSPAIPRALSLPQALRPSLALVIQGVRRCGKSVLMRQLAARYGLPQAHTVFVNFEDPRLSNQLGPPLLDTLVADFRALRPEAERRLFLLDEIQQVPGWERWLRTQLERPGSDLFVVSGSNATLLSGELGAALTGRHLTVELFPFHLAERRLLHPKAGLIEHLRDGGFPEPLQTPDAEALLRQYFHDIVERDIRERVGARSSRPIRQVVQMAYEAAGSELSLRRLAGAVGLATDTAGAYLDAAEAAYLLFQVPFFAWSERQRAHRNRKVYPIDVGLRRVVVAPGSEDRGKALECAAHLTLRRRFGPVSYWRGEGGEVDFVIQEGRSVRPVQVSWEGPQPRHERALESFYHQYPQAEEALWITADTFAELDAGVAPLAR